MENTKIGVDRRVVSVFIYVVIALGGIVPMLLLAWYAFIYEDNERLRLDVMLSSTITISYTLIMIFIGYIPIIINWVIVLFSIKIDNTNLNEIIMVITEVIDFVRLVLMIKLAVDAYKDNNRDLLRKCFSAEY